MSFWVLLESARRRLTQSRAHEPAARVAELRELYGTVETEAQAAEVALLTWGTEEAPEVAKRESLRSLVAASRGLRALTILLAHEVASAVAELQSYLG